ncbi:MAG: response regulator, partial [Thiovulaceae bacterium]|nr:response regulator [Sulfurimonadaceae bacterium]
MDKLDDKSVIEYCKNFSVLVVEDTQTFLLQYTIILEEIFKTVITATNGEEGLEHFKKQHFDLVLTDHYMPKMVGLEMLQQLNALGSDTPSILATSADESDIFIQAINLNISHFLLKPWSKVSLE